MTLLNNPKDNEKLYDLRCKGERDAWKQVYWMVSGVTRWDKWRLTRAESEDIAHDVVEKMLKNGLKSVKKKGSFSSFLKRVTINEIINLFRKRKREGLVPINDGENGNSFSVSNHNNPEKSTIEEYLIKRILRIA